ncbi:hypothetical protein ABDK10_05290 [Staphylococcus aureus]
MSIDKKALFNLSSEPYLKPISDLGVGFYNLDENTAVLQFQLSNSKGPLLISENNLTAYAYFESTNGSASDVIELNIIDGSKGIVEITLDKAFLQASTATTVTGQVYIAVNNHDGDPAYNEVAVFREFNFQVADALINKISSFTKVEYIRMFSQLKQQIEQRVNDIEAAIAAGADYVAEMNATLLNGKTQLNQIVADGTATIDGTVTQAKADITAKINSATSEITTLSNNTKTNVQNTADNAITDITNTSNTAKTHVDTKVAEFNQTVLDNGFVTPEQLTTDLDALTWQKYKLTKDDGYTLYDSNFNLDFNDIGQLSNLGVGTRYAANTLNAPVSASSPSGWVTKFDRGSVKYLEFRPYNSSQVFIKRFYNEWSGWERIDNNQSDTGWIPFNLINGATTNTAYDYGGSRNGYGCAYRIVTIGSLTMTTLRVNGNSVDHAQVIAQLPTNLTESPQVGYIRAPLAHNATSIIIENTGEVKIYIANETEWVNDTSHYFYGEISWINN